MTIGMIRKSIGREKELYMVFIPTNVPENIRLGTQRRTIVN